VSQTEPFPVMRRAGRTRVTLDLSVIEALAMARRLRYEIRKNERLNVKRPFTPEPGRVNHTLEKIRKDSDLLERILDLIEDAGFVIELDENDAITIAPEEE
jgi:hypothetical protein